MKNPKTASVWLHWSIILRFLRPYWIIGSLIAVLLLGDAVFDMSVAFTQGFFIDALQENGRAEIMRLSFMILSALLGFILLLAVHRYLLVWLNYAVHKDMSLHVFDAVNRLPFLFFQKQLPGDILLRVKEDTKHGTDLIEAAVEFITVLIIIGLSFGYLMKVDRLLAVFAIVSIFLIFFSSRFFDKRLQSEAASVETEEAEAQNKILEYMNGIAVIKHEDASQWLISRFARHQTVLHRYRSKLAMTETMADGTAMAVFSTTQLIALALIGLSAARDTLSPGMIVACGLLFELIVWPVLGLSRQWSKMYKAVGAFQRIYDWMEKEPSLEANKNKLESSWTEPLELKLTDVSFWPHTAERPVVEGITMEVRAGEIVAVVGPSGAGKSTLCKLMAGLYEPTSGLVLLPNGSASEQLMKENEDVTYVSQSPAFFSGSIRDNMVLNKMGISDLALIAAAESAALQSVIEQFDDKYEAQLEEKGLNLSGGQRQRLSMSRVFLRQSGLYIFDEPTSALDVQTEQKVMQSLFSFLDGKTAIMVTHKMELARLANRIVVMESGRIVEEGTHDELMQRRNLYFKLCTSGM
ncbi:ABC transporter ATP-binding protein [Paenibacillus paridis]|uniref:ABC transporter ATP-binding protein n=1 Tax=Paenibacillus paridis TaxID=2583376 RepID=UPI001121F0CE|nr:ABC transporter ATP-binding protein [Paenibacillus paridis]